MAKQYKGDFKNNLRAIIEDPMGMLTNLTMHYQGLNRELMPGSPMSCTRLII